MRYRAFSLVEVALATALVAGILVAAIDGVGAVVATRRQTADRTLAAMRAQHLMAEILALPVADPDDGRVAAGPAAGEAGANRELFDNATDYAGWRDTPQQRDGKMILGMEAWRETVEIKRVNPDFGTDVSTSVVLLDVTVQIHGRGRTLASLVVRIAVPVGSAVSITRAAGAEEHA